MTKRSMILLLAGLFVLGPIAAVGGELAFVDLDRAMQLTSKGKETRKKLDAMRDDMELQVRRKELDLRKMQGQLDTQREVLAEEAFKTKVQDFQKSALEYQQMAAEFEQKFARYRVKLLRSFIRDLEAVTRQLAKEKGYKIVILKVEDAVTNSSLVLYGDPSVDLTDQAVKILNEKAAP